MVPIDLLQLLWSKLPSSEFNFNISLATTPIPQLQQFLPALVVIHLSQQKIRRTNNEL